MRILIVDQCSSTKDFPNDLPVIGQDETGELDREEALEKHGISGIPAETLYDGKQQRRIEDAVQTLCGVKQHKVDRHFVSAGFGLVAAEECLPPYEATFNEMSKEEMESRSQRFGLTDGLRELLRNGDYDIVFFALGSKYYSAFELQTVISSSPSDTTIVLFNQEQVDEENDNVVSVPARTVQGKKQGSTVVGLKGTYIKNFAAALDEDEERISLSKAANYCRGNNSQSGFDSYI